MEGGFADEEPGPVVKLETTQPPAWLAVQEKPPVSVSQLEDVPCLVQSSLLRNTSLGPGVSQAVAFGDSAAQNLPREMTSW